MNFTFDWNEWFIIISSTIIFSMFLLIRKYFPPVLVIIIWVFNIEFVASIDYFLAATPFKLYYFSDNATYEASAALFHLFMYPSASLLFLYAYDKWELYGKKTVWYILFWTVYSLFFEWLCLKNHVLTYTGWKMYYSIPTYPISAIVLIILFRFIKKKLHELEIYEA
ncbi:hypothetical protein [Neobacillus ginsengisoli]|uniref:DUF1405 domain-containing protein n=1 Tax=Neobacillus ginsengisoli TaxID=904295 RepID=A0ABT9XUU8_9BACI|nr:hypothetical protein [Neobacillus ginsengisoli]MDQ0198734.1 hypothetical protein [Neobacillus ginsengisoli]